MRVCGLNFIVAVAVQLAVVCSGSVRVTTLYTVKKFDFQFSTEFFTDITAFYLPVRGKWGRVSVNITVVKTIAAFWMDLETFRQDDSKIFQRLSPQFSVNLCDLTTDIDNSLLFKFIPGIKKHIKTFIRKCPIDPGVQLAVPDRTLKQIPRQSGVGPIIPSGLYKISCTLRTDQNQSLGDIDVRFQFRGF